VGGAPALAGADVGIAVSAPGQAGDACARAAALAGCGHGDAHIGGAVSLARATLANIRQNLGWAFGFNALMIPLAMAGRVDPMWAAAAMASSSLVVIGNALRLRRWRPKRRT